MVALILSMIVPLVQDDLPSGAVARLGSTRWRTIGPASCQCFFHPDGKRLIRVGGYEGTACVLDIATGKIIQRLETHDQRMQEGALSRDGRWLACLGHRTAEDENSTTLSQGTHVFELSTGKVVRTWPESSQSKIALSEDGSILARCVWHKEGGEHVHVSSVHQGVEKLKWRKGDNSGVLSLQLSNDGNLLAIVKYSHEQGKTMTLYLVDIAKQETIVERQLHRMTNITYHSVDAGCRWLAYYDRETASIVMEDFRTGRVLIRWPFTPSARADAPAPGKAIPDDNPSLGFAFSSDGSRLLAAEGALFGTNAKSLQLLLFDVTNGKLLKRWVRETRWQSIPSISPDNSTVACGGNGNGIELFDAATGNQLNPAVHDNPPGDIRAMVFSPDGKTLALAGHDNCIDTWETTKWTRLARWKAPQLMANSMAYSPDGTRLLLGLFGAQAEIWDVASRKHQFRFRALQGYVNAVAWMRDGKTVAVAGMAPRPLALHDAESGTELISYPSSGSNGSAFIENGEYWTNSSQLVQTRTGRVLASVPHSQKQPLYQLAYSHQSLLAQTSNRQLTMYERATMKQRWKVDDGGWVIAFSHDGRYVAYGQGWDHVSIPRAITVRDAVTGEVRYQWAGHSGLQKMCFTPDDSHVLSGGNDGTVLVWKLPSIPVAAGWNPAEAEKAWKHLESDNALIAARAIAQLSRHPEEVVPWISERLEASLAPEKAIILAAIEKLNHSAFEQRQQAYEQLKRLGKQAESLLKEQLETRKEIETRRRIESLLTEIETLQLTAAERQALRAVEIIERIKTPAATQLLARWAAGAKDARLTQLAAECHQLRVK